MFRYCASSCLQSGSGAEVLVTAVPSLEEHPIDQDSARSYEPVSAEARLLEQQVAEKQLHVAGKELRVASRWLSFAQRLEESWARTGLEGWRQEQQELRVASLWLTLAQQLEEAWVRAGVEGWKREQEDNAKAALRKLEEEEARRFQRKAEARAAAEAEAAAAVADRLRAEAEAAAKATAEAEAAAKAAADTEAAAAEQRARAEAEASAKAAAEAKAAERAHAESAAYRRQVAVQTFLFSRGFTGVTAPKKSLTKTTYALHEAAKLGSADMAQMLLQAGADPRQKNSRGKTALERAREADKNGSHAIVISVLERASSGEASFGGA